MHSTLFVAALAALPATFAAPPRLPTAHFTLTKRCNDTSQNDTTSEATPSPPKCDLSKITQPASTLNPPDAMTLVMIAHGLGTQNYTCGANLTAPPTSIGAVAQLFDLSCAMADSASSGPSTPATKAAVLKAAVDAQDSFGSITESPSIGQHFFIDNTTPDFDIIGLGNTQTKKVQDCNAPNPDADVKWLRLQAQSGSTSAVKMIYRLNTKGGMQPKTCEGKAQGEVVTVGYEAQYWIYE